MPPVPERQIGTAGATIYYSAALFGILLCFYGGMYWLWAAGNQALYLGIMHKLGVDAFAWPFLDLDNMFASIECNALGFNTTRVNPCDALERPYTYPPTWLTLLPGSLTRGDTTFAGIVLSLSFLVTVPLVLRPASPARLFIAAIEIGRAHV